MHYDGDMAYYTPLKEHDAKRNTSVADAKRDVMALACRLRRTGALRMSHKRHGYGREARTRRQVLDLFLFWEVEEGLIGASDLS